MPSTRNKKSIFTEPEERIEKRRRRYLRCKIRIVKVFREKSSSSKMRTG